jgi:hypothetical protein
MYATKEANCTMSYRPGVVSLIGHTLNFLSRFKYAEKLSIFKNLSLLEKKE